MIGSCCREGSRERGLCLCVLREFGPTPTRQILRRNDSLLCAFMDTGKSYILESLIRPSLCSLLKQDVIKGGRLEDDGLESAS